MFGGQVSLLQFLVKMLHIGGIARRLHIGGKARRQQQ